MNTKYIKLVLIFFFFVFVIRGKSFKQYYGFLNTKRNKVHIFKCIHNWTIIKIWSQWSFNKNNQIEINSLPPSNRPSRPHHIHKLCVLPFFISGGTYCFDNLKLYLWNKTCISGFVYQLSLFLVSIKYALIEVTS